MDRITSRTASVPSSIVYVYAWWMVPRKSATRFAALRSGLPSRPTVKEWSLGKEEERRATLRAQMEATREESRPPERRTPQGTSDIMRRVTAFSKAWRRTSWTDRTKNDIRLSDRNEHSEKTRPALLPP